MSHSAQYWLVQMSESICCLKRAVGRQTRRPNLHSRNRVGPDRARFSRPPGRLLKVTIGTGRVGMNDTTPRPTQGKVVFLASKIGWSKIAFALLTTGMLVPASPPTAAAGSDPSKEGATAFIVKNEIRKVQDTLRDKGHYRGKIDGVLGLRTRASIRAYQKAENLPVTGQVDIRTADGLGVRPESTWGDSQGTAEVDLVRDHAG